MLQSQDIKLYFFYEVGVVRAPSRFAWSEAELELWCAKSKTST